MLRTLFKQERNILCHSAVLGHIAKHWDSYKEIVNISIANKSLRLVREERIRSLIEEALEVVKEITGLDRVATRLPGSLGATQRGLFNVFVWLFMSLDDSSQPPSNPLGGAETCGA